VCCTTTWSGSFLFRSSLIKRQRQTVLSTTGASQLRDNIANVLGDNLLKKMCPVDSQRPTASDVDNDDEDLDEAQHNKRSLDAPKNGSITHNKNNNNSHVRFEGYISKPLTGNGRSANDRQFFFLNKR
jgi:DNA mismatch repair ATPase MutL